MAIDYAFDNHRMEIRFLPQYILEKKIIIVGAGISGLTCAQKLQKYGFENVNILEATDRIGGRLYTFNTKERNLSKRMKKDNDEWSYLEMGTQRVHGDSSLYKKALHFNEIDGSAPEYSEALENLHLVYNKNECLAISILRNYFSRRLCFPKDFSKILEDDEFSQLFEGREQHLIDCMRDYMRGTYQWWFGMSYEFAHSHKQAELLSGYSGLLQSLNRNLSRGTVIPNKEVVKIDWRDFDEEKCKKSYIFEPRIKVRCRDNTSYDADHVIVAIPLGYLKENFKTLFVPSLPEDKVEAIKNLSFVTVNKIFFEYENPFWKPTDVYHVVWKDSLNLLFRNHKHDSGQDPSSWLQYINRFEYLHTSKNTLCAWIWGEGAVIMEKLSEEEIACCCTRLLQYLTRKSLPKPKVTRTKWYSNPYFRGSLVYDPSQGVLHYMKKLSESIPVKGDQLILQFAGDAAFDTGQMSTVHGAIQAGKRVAKELFHHNAHKARMHSEENLIIMHIKLVCTQKRINKL